MKKSPKERFERLQRILRAWKTRAADKKFGGMTVTEFEAFIAPSGAVRELLVDLDDRIATALNQREDVDNFSDGKAELAVNGVIGDPEFGPNSDLYEAMGYTRKSERKSGLTRKGGGSTPPAPKP